MLRRTIFPLVAAALLACANVQDVAAASMACPPSDTFLLRFLRWTLADPRYRADIAVWRVRPESLRTLKDPADAAICKAIMRKVRWKTSDNPDYVDKYSLLAADGYYFLVVMTRTQRGFFVKRPGLLILLDTELRGVSTTTI